MSKDDKLVRVEASHFVAGLIISGLDHRCERAAPILEWALNKHENELRAYFRRQGWKATIVRPRSEIGP